MWKLIRTSQLKLVLGRPIEGALVPYPKQEGIILYLQQENVPPLVPQPMENTVAQPMKTHHLELLLSSNKCYFSFTNDFLAPPSFL